MPRKIEVEIVGDSRKLERAFDRSSRSAKRFNQDLTRSRAVLGRLGTGLGVAGIGIAVREVVSAASDLQEQMSKTNVVFGDSAASIEAWSETTTDAFGISRRQALATASSFGALFAPLGVAGDLAAKQSQRLTELGADLASFYNTDVQAALDAIRSGIVGEAEPLRRYGVLLSEVRVQQQAMADTGKRSATQLTAQEKALARIRIIFQDTAQAQGDFARTSESVANQSRVAQANLDDLKVELGTGLIPAFSTALGVVNDFVDALQRLGDTQVGKALNKSAIDLARDFANIRPIHGGRKFSGEIEDFMGLGSLFERRGPPAPGAAARRRRTPRGQTAARRNFYFDQRIARQLDRLQDASLSKQAARLSQLAGEVRARLAITKDATRRVTLEDQLLDIQRQQRSVLEQQQSEQAGIVAKIKEANEALKARAEAIKSAVIERLQRRQTDILNRRALADAREQLRIARQLGGPGALRTATRALQDVRFDILRARIEAAPATLTAAGRFQLGNVITINIHGVTDPDAVARRVERILQKRRRHSSTQTRGPAATH